jgi:hypothetical protein
MCGGCGRKLKIKNAKLKIRSEKKQKLQPGRVWTKQVHPHPTLSLKGEG